MLGQERPGADGWVLGVAGNGVYEGSRLLDRVSGVIPWG